MYRITPVMHAAAVWYKVSETAEAPNCYDYALRGRRKLCVHDRALRDRFSMLLGCMRTPVVRERAGYMAVAVGGSKNFPHLL